MNSIEEDSRFNPAVKIKNLDNEKSSSILNTYSIPFGSSSIWFSNIAKVSPTSIESSCSQELCFSRSGDTDGSSCDWPIDHMPCHERSIIMDFLSKRLRNRLIKKYPILENWFM
jgi:hypothetical protein